MKLPTDRVSGNASAVAWRHTPQQLRLCNQVHQDQLASTASLSPLLRNSTAC